MRTIDELKTYYRQDLKAELAQYEGRRKGLLLRYCILFAVVVTAGYFAGLDGPGVLVIIAGIVGLVIYIYRSSIRYVLDFKSQILGKLMAYTSPGLTYEPKRHIPENEFKASRLFERSRYNRYGGDDFAYGEIDGLDIHFSELRVVQSGSKNNSTTIFQGLFLVAKTPRTFRGTTTVAPELLKNLQLPKGMLGDMARKLIEKLLPEPTGSAVAFDDPEFNEQFTVYSDEPDEAARFLNDEVRASILDLNRQTQEPTRGSHPYQRQNVRLAFSGSTIYVALHCNRSLFSVNLFRTLKSYRMVDRFFEDLHKALTVVTALQAVTQES